MNIRRATPADAPAIASIYSWYARHTAITFATEGPTVAEFEHKILDARYPFLAAEENGAVFGFAYAGEFRTKEAYRWDVELTIYLRPGCEGRGAGRLLMEECLRILTAQGYLNAYSCITIPNERSVGLHERCGFESLGVFPRTGYKLGKWHDVVWLWKQLTPAADEPAEPKRLTEIEHCL